MPGATDNYVGNPGTGGESYASDAIASVHYPRLKLSWGVDGAAVDASATNPLPVTLTSTTVTGTVAVTGTFWQATQPVSLASTTITGSVAVTGAFFQATQPVSIAATVAVSGPLTDAQLRAVAVPVSGTFFQATQPVSIASMPSTPVTGTFWQATQPVSGTVTVNTISGFATEATLAARIPANGQALMAASVPVTIASNQSAVPVSGTFWQATQPVSLTSTTVTGTVAVSGTFWQATQPVSLTSTTITGTVAVTAPTITKGTQGANGLTTQNLKDAGRSQRQIFLDSFAVAATAETLMTMSYSTDNGTVTTGTSYSVTTGKRLRLQSIVIALHTIAGNTTAVNVIVRIRANNAGAALVSSPIQLVIPVQGVAAANQAGIPVVVPIPDGWEFVAGAGVGVTVACSGFVATTAAPKVDITIIANEY